MSDVLSPTTVSAALAPDDAALEATAEKALRKKQEKLRSAWISFVGRILAQLIGAVATVTLGLYAVSTYKSEQPSVLVAATTADSTPVRTPRADGRSLAVLPFEDFSPDRRSDYFVDGLTEALIANLARGGHVHVTSRTSSMHYKHSRQPLPTIARALAVDYIVEGSVVRQDRRVRVTVQLIDARSDDHVWAETFDRADKDLLALQADVTAAITTRLQAAMPAAAGEANRP